MCWLFGNNSGHKQVFMVYTIRLVSDKKLTEPHKRATELASVPYGLTVSAIVRLLTFDICTFHGIENQNQK